MTLKTELAADVAEIFRARWETREGDKVPEAEDLGLGNEAVRLKATVLYADLADSTPLVTGYRDWFAAEIYKTFLRCAAKIIRYESGAITAYDGDRVMAVYIGNAKNTSAVRTALKINHAVREIINPARLRRYPDNDYSVRQVVGVDTSDLFVARTGVRGANDLVWVGRAANYAAKLAALPESWSSYITADVYENMHDSVKLDENKTDIWTALRWSEFDDSVIYGSNGWVEFN